MMSKPTLGDMTFDDAGDQGWDGQLSTKLETVKAVLESAPNPIKEYASEGSLPTASTHDRCLAMVNNGDSGWCLFLSDGSSWKLIGKQAAAVADLSLTASGTYQQSELQAVADKVDALLAALRASGVVDT
ncbi:MAG: hypothetical protein ACF8XB_14110 [Planctomycetota bacterium JB042]